MKKDLTTEDRVDRLLKYGVDKPEKWMSVHNYKEPSLQEEYLNVVDWKQEWEKLRQHHLAETVVLFEIVKELRQRLPNE